ncbi:oligopeptide/dipeptide ABC transporter ATP-binding protein [Vagococcus silagei]|nr:oligopeptide/dipeptide ABC transporter ATP-binding protein [Vagococcus silagei]
MNYEISSVSHDLGIVGNFADRVAIMYAGKIVEYGTTLEVFYQAKHPYTWGLIQSIPIQGQPLYSIPGTPPSIYQVKAGDAFFERNDYALVIDELEEPPFFKVSDTHFAATWLLAEDAPEVIVPSNIQARYDQYEAWQLARRDQYGTVKS